MMHEVNKWIAREMLTTMPEAKKELFRKACQRNAMLTGCYELENITITVYVEGWLLRLDGCRSSFAVFAFDCDGAFVFGRKPAEKTLEKIYSEWDKTWHVIEAEEI